MAFAIGIVSSELLVPRIQEVSSEFSDVHFYYYTYKQASDAREIAQTMREVDAIFFAGTFPYYHAKPIIEERGIPVYVMRQDEAVITASLLQASWTYQVSSDEISIDVTEPQLVHEIIGEISPSHPVGPVLQITPEMPLSAIVQFHTRAQTSGRAKVAVTSIHAVHEELSSRGMHSLFMHELRRTLSRALAQTAYLARLAKSQKAEPAVLLARHSGNDPHFTTMLRQYLQSPWFSYDADTAQFITTRKHVDYVIGLSEFREYLETSGAQTGIGYGLDILSATKHAEDALDYSGPGEIFMMDAQKNLSSPISSARISLKLTEPNQVQLAKRMGLSPANLSKLLRFHAIHPSNQFTAQDLENHLQVTRRSTERIIKKCVDHGLIIASGEEMTYQQGRPRTIYTFTLPDYLS